MKAVKVVFGTLAALFAVPHAVGLDAALLSGDSAGFAFSRYMGRIAGLLIGLIIALTCLVTEKPADESAGSAAGGDGDA
jgi:hypothetical protein